MYTQNDSHVGIYGPLWREGGAGSWRLESQQCSIGSALGGRETPFSTLLKVIQLFSVRFRIQMVNVVALKPDELWNFLPAHPDE